MSIGSYEHEWFMKTPHISPKIAVPAFLDIKAKHFIPMYSGAFPLLDETPKVAFTELHNN